MIKFFGLFVFLLFTVAEAHGRIENVRGKYQLDGRTYTFSLQVARRQWVRLFWDDGSPGFVATYNPRPNPAPRCPCEIYEVGHRSITLEIGQHGQITSVRYLKDPVYTGAYEKNGNSYGFKVSIRSRAFATLTWNDGTKGFVATYNPTPDPAPRCKCDVYESGRRRIYAYMDIDTGEVNRVEYERD